MGMICNEDDLRMIRWMYDHMKLGKIRNVIIRDKVGVPSIENKMRKARLRWLNMQGGV